MNRKLRNYFTILISLLTVTEVKAQNNYFTIEGKIFGKQTGCLYLIYIDKEGEKVIDSCFIQDERFYFEGRINEPTLAQLISDKKITTYDDPNFTDFFIQPNSITVTVKFNHFKEIEIANCKTQTEYKILLTQHDSLKNKIASNSVDFDPSPEFSRLDYQFIVTHSTSYVSAFLLTFYKSNWSLDSIRLLYNKLSPAIQKSFYGKDVAKTIDEITHNSPGNKAKQFAAMDLNGELITLSKFKNRYILLDFWASWCLPCRQSTPHLKELYKKFRDRGLDVISVSSDENIEAWKTAIKKDEINIWHNILSRFKIDNTREINESRWITNKFGVQVLPTKILIDKNGIIIGRYSGTEEGPALYEKLRKIFK